MPKVLQLELMSVDLPFRRAFRHAAAARKSSESLFLKCVTEAGAVGFGESLPREYVTGETRDKAFALLERFVLPELIGIEFGSMKDVYEFLRTAKYFEGCYGKHLLRDDPVSPCLQLRYGGRPPKLPGGFGPGVEVDETKLNRWVRKRALVEGRLKIQKRGGSHVASCQINPFADRLYHGQRV